MLPSLSIDPVFGGILVMVTGIIFLIRENLELRKRLRDSINESNAVIRSDQILISEMETEILRLSGIICSARQDDPSPEKDFVSRETWACAVLGLNPEKAPFNREEIASARKKSLMRSHPDHGGSGRIDDVEVAAQTLREGQKAPA